jgi:hypothetical protein
MHNIYETLGAFMKGSLTKRSAHTKILDTLEGHDDLRQDLMNVLVHRDARWAPGDFDLPTEHSVQPFLEPFPQFLQPTFQPQTRLPSISSSWFPLPQIDQSTGSAAFDGYNDCGNTNPSPALPSFAQADTSTPHWTEYGGKITYTDDKDHTSVPSLVQIPFSNPWVQPKYDNTWTNADLGPPPDGTHINEYYEQHQWSSTAYTNSPHPSVSNVQDINPIAAALQREDPQCTRSPQFTYDLLPLPMGSNPVHTTLEQLPLEEPQPYLSPVSEESQGVIGAKHEAKQAQDDAMMVGSRSLRGLFIHSLCGKGFATLSKVKKHHWGKKQNDPETKTGCWAKHNKPATAWDDHPSCKDGRSSFQTTRFDPSAPKHTKLNAFTTPAVDTIPGFPTLEDLPYTVAKVLNVNIPTTPTPGELRARYHNHYLPSESHIGGLLEAVNIASKIEHPVPHSRKVSIVQHLDTQASAMEANDQPSRSATCAALENSFDLPCPRNVVPIVANSNFSQLEDNRPVRTSTPFTTRTNEEQTSPVALSGSGGSRVAAASSVLSKATGSELPGPARKKRRV